MDTIYVLFIYVGLISPCFPSAGSKPSAPLPAAAAAVSAAAPSRSPFFAIVFNNIDEPPRSVSLEHDQIPNPN